MCAGCCESIRRFLFLEMFSYQRTPEAVSCQRSQDYPRTVGGEVEPVSASRIRAGGLQHLDASAHQCRAYDSPGNYAFWGKKPVVDKVFYP